MLRIVIAGLVLAFAAGSARANEDQEKRDTASVPAAGNTAAASDVTKPSSDELKKVLEYYNRGRDVMLFEHKFCRDVGKDKDTKNDCVNEVAATEIPKGEKAILWMNFVVPREFKEGNLLIQFNQNGVTRSAATRSITVKDGALR